MGKKITVEQKWHQDLEAAAAEAEKLPHGKDREALVRKARQLIRLPSWLNGCRPQNLSRLSSPLGFMDEVPRFRPVSCLMAFLCAQVH